MGPNKVSVTCRRVEKFPVKGRCESTSAMSNSKLSTRKFDPPSNFHRVGYPMNGELDFRES